MTGFAVIASVRAFCTHGSICRANTRYFLKYSSILWHAFIYSFPSLFPFAEYLRSETAFLEELVFGSGDTIELSCNTQSSSVSVFWFKDGIGIAPSNRTHIGQKLLKIINVSYDDSGLYSCKPRHSNEVLGNFTVRVTGTCRNRVDSLVFFVYFCPFTCSAQLVICMFLPLLGQSVPPQQALAVIILEKQKTIRECLCVSTKC